MGKIRQYVERAVDYVVALGDPRRAAVRRHYRTWATSETYRELVGAMARAIGYRNAKRKAGQGPWGMGGSADAHTTPLERTALADRARELDRDDPLASGLLNNFVKKVIGSGIRPQAITGDPKVNEALEQIFRQRQDSLDAVHDLDFAGFQRMSFRTGYRDGEVVLKGVIYRAGDPLQFEIIECDRVRTPPSPRPAREGGRIVDGVEKDEFGRIVAYHILKRHPGDPLQIGEKYKPLDFDRVPAEAIIRLWEPERPGQSRGVTRFHALLQDMRDLDLLMVASLKRMEFAACLAAFIKSDSSIQDALRGLHGSNDIPDDSSGGLVGTLTPGMVFKLDPGEEIQTVLPNFPTPELWPFVKMLSMRIAASVGITWEEVLANYSEDNYSSARTGLLESRATYTLLQHWFASRVLKPVWISVLEDARQQDPRRFDGIPAGAEHAVRFVAPGWRWVDPDKEVKASVRALRTGLTTLQEELASRGLDWEEQLEQIAREQDRMKSMGLEGLLVAIYGDPNTTDKSLSAEPARQILDMDLEAAVRDAVEDLREDAA